LHGIVSNVHAISLVSLVRFTTTHWNALHTIASIGLYIHENIYETPLSAANRPNWGQNRMRYKRVNIFFLWGYLRQKIRERNPEDDPQLRRAITEIFSTTTPKKCAFTCRMVYNRLLKCVANNNRCIPQAIVSCIQ